MSEQIKVILPSVNEGAVQAINLIQAIRTEAAKKRPDQAKLDECWATLLGYFVFEDSPYRIYRGYSRNCVTPEPVSCSSVFNSYGGVRAYDRETYTATTPLGVSPLAALSFGFRKLLGEFNHESENADPICIDHLLTVFGHFHSLFLKRRTAPSDVIKRIISHNFSANYQILEGKLLHFAKTGELPNWITTEGSNLQLATASDRWNALITIGGFATLGFIFISHHSHSSLKQRGFIVSVAPDWTDSVILNFIKSLSTSPSLGALGKYAFHPGNLPINSQDVLRLPTVGSEKIEPLLSELPPTKAIMLVQAWLYFTDDFDAFDHIVFDQELRGEDAKLYNRLKDLQEQSRDLKKLVDNKSAVEVVAERIDAFVAATCKEIDDAFAV